MSAPYSIANQNTNKCPHGFPVGTCPLCSGSGGENRVPQDKNTPRKAGEMTYNECMAEWIRMQAQQKAQDRKEAQIIQQLQLAQLEKKISQRLENFEKTLQKLIQNFDDNKTLLNSIAKFTIKLIALPIIKIALAIPKIINFVQNFAQNILVKIISVLEKLPSIFGEIKNFTSAFAENIKKKLKTLGAFFVEKEEKEEENEEIEKLKKREMNIKKIFIRKRKNKEENDN